MVKFDFMYGCGDVPWLRCNVLQYFLSVNSFTFFIKQYQCPYLVLAKHTPDIV